jgi:hypothetical protein
MLKNGRFAKVTLGTYVITALGSWTIDGWANDVVEVTSFGDIAKIYEFTMQSYGTVRMVGFYNLDDTTGQLLLMSAFQNQSKITNIRFYIDSTSYYTPGVTSMTSSAVMITSVSPVEFEKANVGKITFTGQINGVLTLI